MIQLSSITHAISSATYNAAFYTKKLCVDSKVDRVFHTTVGAIHAHPYIAFFGATVGVYCCRGQIKSLVIKVMQAAQCLYTKTINSLKNITNLFKSPPEKDLPPSNLDASIPPPSGN